MSATDELRRMLDERGVEWWSEDDPEEPAYYFVTKWFANAHEQTYEEIPAIRSRSLKAFCVFPEQAIAATLGIDRHPYEQRITGDGSNWAEIMADAFDDLIASAAESCTHDELTALESHIAATMGDDATAFAKRVEQAVAKREPLTLFGVDYDTACVDKGIPQGADGNLDQSQVDWLRLMPDGWDGTPPTLDECEVVSTEDTCDFVHKRHTLSCGHVVGAYSEPPNFCPKCGRKVRKAVER